MMDWQFDEDLERERRSVMEDVEALAQATAARVTKPIPPPPADIAIKPMPPEEATELPAPPPMEPVATEAAEEETIAPPEAIATPTPQEAPEVIAAPEPMEEPPVPKLDFSYGAPVWEAVEIGLEKELGRPPTRVEVIKEIRRLQYEQGDPISNIARSIDAGLQLGVTDLAKMALRLIGKEDWIPYVTLKREEADYLDIPPEDSALYNIFQGVRGATPSAVLLGTALALRIPPWTVAPVIGGMFGYNQYKEVLERAEEAGLDPNDPAVQRNAILQGLTEGGLEMVADAVIGGRLAKMAMAPALRHVLGREGIAATVGRTLKDAAVILGTEIPQEAITAGVEAYLDRQLGLPSPDPLTAAKMAVMPTFWGSLLFLGLGKTAAAIHKLEMPVGQPSPAEQYEAQAVEYINKATEAAEADDIKAAQAHLEKAEAYALSYAQSVATPVDTLGVLPKAVQEAAPPTTPHDLPTVTPETVLIPDRTKLKAMLETAMPGVQVRARGVYGEKIIATLPNGTEFEVKWPANIVVNRTDPRFRGKAVAGIWSPMRNLMALSGEYATQATIDEEAYHVAQTLVLTDRELREEIRHFSTTNKPLHQMTNQEIVDAMERAAKGYVEWVTNWRNTPAQHSNWVKIREWAAKLARSAFGIYKPEDIWQEVATGKIWSRDPRQVPLTANRIGVLTQVKDVDGRYVGAPPHIQTDEDYAREVDKLVSILQKETDPKWYWFYDEAARVVRELTNGNVTHADILMKLLAVTSPLSDVPSNVGKAIRAYLKWKHEGGDFVLPGLNKLRMSDVLKMEGPDLQKYPGVGPKVNAFYHNLVSAYYKTADDRVTNDQWMARLLGYKAIHFTPAQYKFAQGFIQDVTERLNLLTDGNYQPKHVQSALWFWVRAKESQIADPYSSFHTALEGLQHKVTFELFPGSQLSQMPGINEYFQRLADIVMKGNRNVLLDILTGRNPDNFANITTALGGWAGTNSPNLVAAYTSDEPVKSPIVWEEYKQTYYPIQLSRTLAAATGYIYAQDGVAWFRPITPAAAKRLLAKGKRGRYTDPQWFLHGHALVIKNISPKGLEVPITADQAMAYMKDVWNEGLEIGYTLHNGTLYVCNFRFEWSGWDFPIPTKDIAQALQKHLMPGWEMRLTDIIGEVAERRIYEPNPEDPNNPRGVDRKDWLQQHLEPEQWAAIHSLHMEAASIYKEIQARYGEAVTLPEDAFTSIRELNIDPDDILDLTEEIQVHEKYVGSLNIPRFTDDDHLKSVAKKLYLANQAEIDAARRLMTWDEIRKMGRRLHIDEKTLEAFQKQKGLNREQMYALIRLNKWAVSNLSAKALQYRQNPTPDTLDEVKLAYAAAAEIMKTYQMAATEWGYVGAVLSAQETIRPLREWWRQAAQPTAQPTAQPRPALEAEAFRRLAKRNEIIIRRVTKALGGQQLSHETMTRLTQLLSNPDATERDVVRFIQQTAKATTADKIFTAWINNLFSFKTHAVNMTSNMLTLLLGPMTRTTAGVIDTLESLVTGKPKEVFAREGWEYALGTLTAIPEALKIGLNTLVTNMSTYEETKLEHMKPEPFKSPAAKALFTYNLRLLQAADDFAKTLVYRGALRANIFREMRRRRPSNPRQFLQDALDNPEAFAPELSQEAMAEAVYRTFQMHSKLADWLGQEPTGALKWVIPFKRTLINIVKMGLEHTPAEAVALAMGKTFGMKYPTTGAEAKIQAAKIMLGSSLLFTGYLLAHAGLLSGSGPSDKRERENLYALGWRPYTIKTPLGRLEYGRIEPIATLLGVIADSHDVIKYAALPGVETDKIISRAAMTLSKNIVDKTMLIGLMRFLLAAMQPEVYGEKWWYGFVTSAVPASITQFVRADDPTLRNPANLVEAFKARLPVVNRDVAPIYDRWGYPVMPAEGISPLQRLVSPMPIYEPKVAHPIDLVLLEKGVKVAPPTEKVRIRGISVELTPQQQEIVAEGRRTALKILNAMADSLRQAPPDQVDRMVRNVLSAQNRVVRAKLLADPTFYQRLRQLQEEGKLQRMEKAQLYSELVID